MSHTVLVGTAEYRSQEYPIILPSQDRLRHMYSLGKTGTGKSTLYQNMMLQDIYAGAGCCFVDPHGEAIDWLLQNIPDNRLEDVILFDPSETEWPMGMNLLEYHSDSEKDFLVSEAIHIFYKLFDPQQSGVIGPQFEHWMRNAALTIMADPHGGTLIEIPRLFTDPEFERYKRKYVTDPIVRTFWEQQMEKTSAFHRSEMLNYFTSKFGRFMTNSLMRNIIGQKQSSFSLSDAINNQKILLINLSKGKIGELNAAMLGLIIMTKLQMAVMKRASLPKEERKPFYLFVDEFHNVMTDAFISMLSEARKYGLAVHLTNQYVAQLTDEIREAVLGNVATLVAFQIGAQDAEVLLSEFESNSKSKSRSLTTDDFQFLEPHHFFIRLTVDGVPQYPVIARGILPRRIQTTVSAEDTKILSRLRYSRPRTLVEQDQSERLHVVY